MFFIMLSSDFWNDLKGTVDQVFVYGRLINQNALIGYERVLRLLL